MVRDARGHGQPLAATKQKGQGENLVDSDEVMLKLCRIDVFATLSQSDVKFADRL